MDESEKIITMLQTLQLEVADLRAKDEKSSMNIVQDERVDSVMKMVRELKEELLEVKDNLDKSITSLHTDTSISAQVSSRISHKETVITVHELRSTGEDPIVDENKGGASQTAMPNMQTKGINAPGGMSTEQLQEFKKQTLQINGLQQKMKDLESKLTEAVANIKKGNERAGEMEEKSVENVKDLYSTIEQINNSLSEKIGLQRVEMQKIAGDTPRAINYDPFNYGEAYTGDFVDFQSRKRITEIKLLLQSLQAAMNSLRESVKVSPAVDLGYKVVRLDQLLAATGFQDAIVTGEASHDDVVVITQPTSREPGRVEMPRKEMFQTSDDMESKWAITDSIMQTMYRLEIELGELQKLVGASDSSNQTKAMEEVHLAIRQMKDKQLDVKMVKRLIEDSNLMVNVPAKIRQASVDFKQQRDDSTSRANLEDSSRPIIKHLQTAVESILKRLKEIETHHQTRPSAAVKKMSKGSKRPACLSCDAGIDPNYVYKTSKRIPRSDLFDATSANNLQALVKMPSRLRYILNRTYSIDTSDVKADEYSIPRPCGASYAVYWPVVESTKKQPQPEPAAPLEVTGHNRLRSHMFTKFKIGNSVVCTCGLAPETAEHILQDRPKYDILKKRNFIRGNDGHYYVGCDIPVVKSEYQRRLPVVIMKADVHDRRCFHYKAGIGGTVVRDLQYQGKQALLTTLLLKKETRRPVVSKGLAVIGEKKEPTANEGVLEVTEILEIPEIPQEQEVKPTSETEIVEVVEETAEELPLEEEKDFDNTAFFTEENTTENARANLALWSGSPDNNNNAHHRPHGFMCCKSTFNHIMEQMNAANAWPPELGKKITTPTDSTASGVGSEVSDCKNVSPVQLREQTISLSLGVSDVNKNNDTRKTTGIHQDRQAAVTIHCRRSKETAKHIRKHQQLPRQQILLVTIPRKPHDLKRICTLVQTLPDCCRMQVQTSQSQPNPLTKCHREQIRQQQVLPTSCHKVVEKKILKLKLRMQKELQNSQGQQYATEQRNEQCQELPPLRQKQRKGKHKKPDICQQKSVAPWRDTSLWPNIKDSDLDLLQMQIEKHRQLRSIDYWLDYTNSNDQKDLVKLSKTKSDSLVTQS